MVMRGRIAVKGVVAAAASMLFLSAAPAEAGKNRIETTVTLKISFTPPARDAAPARRGTFYYYGKVKSPKVACRRGREVTLIRDTKQVPGEGGTDTSDAEGAWLIVGLVNPPGDYYVTVKRKVLASGKICKPAVSESVARP